MQRELDLASTYRAHPDRFPQGELKAPALPQAVWINPPQPQDSSLAYLRKTERLSRTTWPLPDHKSYGQLRRYVVLAIWILMWANPLILRSGIREQPLKQEINIGCRIFVTERICERIGTLIDYVWLDNKMESGHGKPG